MQCRLLFLLIAITLFNPIIGRCQGNFLSIGGGVTSGSLVDKGFSPLIFSGIQANGIIAFENSPKNKEKIRSLHFSSGSLENRFGRDLNSFTIMYTDYTIYSKGEDSKRLFWGWSNNNSFTQRHLSDFSNYNGRANYFTSLGPAAKYSVPFEVKGQKLYFHILSHIQLIGFYIPSGYVSSLPAGFSDPQGGVIQSIFRSAFVFYPGNAFNLGIWPKVQWESKLGNRISVNYVYDYAAFKRIHSFRKSQGSLFFTLSTRL